MSEKAASKNGVHEPLSLSISFEHWTANELAEWMEANGNAARILKVIRRLAPVKKWNRDGDPNDPDVLNELSIDDWASYSQSITRFLNRMWADGCRTSITGVVDVSEWQTKDLAEWQENAADPNGLFHVVPILRPFKSWNRDGDPHDPETLRQLPAREYIDLMRIVRDEIQSRFQRS